MDFDLENRVQIVDAAMAQGIPGDDAKLSLHPERSRSIPDLILDAFLNDFRPQNDKTS